MSSPARRAASLSTVLELLRSGRWRLRPVMARMRPAAFARIARRCCLVRLDDGSWVPGEGTYAVLEAHIARRVAARIRLPAPSTTTAVA